jgi:AraC-like DNA-binding protein
MANDGKNILKSWLILPLRSLPFGKNVVTDNVIPIGFVSDALDYARACGLPAAPLLAKAGIPAASSLARDARVSVRQFAMLWRAVSIAAEDEAFGVGARAMRPGSFDMLCNCVIHSPSLGKAIRRALQFLNLVLDDPRGRLVTEGRTARILLEDAAPPRSAFAYRAYWVMLHGVICWLVGRRIPLQQVDFSAAEPSGGNDFRLFFGTPVSFGQPCGQIIFDTRFLKLPIVRSERSLTNFLRRAPENILVGYYDDAGTADVLRQLLQSGAPEEWPGFDEISRQLRMPMTTLRRRLKEEGQSFHALKDEVRRDMAVQLLLTTELSVGDVSAKLGYREASAFYRAFQNWMACSPGHYRSTARQHGSESRNYRGS